jgi:hypothetical protein
LLIFYSISDLPISIIPSSQKEICDATKAMNIGKAASSDNITVNFLKADSYATVVIYLPLLQDMWQKENFPNN